MARNKRKKKLAFVVTSFQVGGVEKALLQLLRQFDRSRYELTVFLPDEAGAWTERLRAEVPVVILRMEPFRTVLKKELRSLRVWSFLRSLFFRLLSRRVTPRNYHRGYAFFIRSLDRWPGRFDCAIAYQIVNDDCVLSCLYRLRAKKRVAWSHAVIHKEDPIYPEWYSRFDRIFCVSDYARRVLLQNMPVLRDKAGVYYNHMDPEEIRRLAAAPGPLSGPEGTLLLLTVGRLSPEKGQLLIPPAARILLDSGCRFLWYLVGDGPSAQEIRAAIRAEGVQNWVILLGNLDNPYPCMRQCDIYVQTSLTEGWGLTVSEAKALAKPIVTTDAGVMSEQIRSGKTGIIVPQAQPEALARGILTLAEQPALRAAFSEQLAREDLARPQELRKLLRIIDG